MTLTTLNKSQSIVKGKKAKELSNSDRKAIVIAIAAHCKDGLPPRGIFEKISLTVGVHQTTINTIWKTHGLYADQALSLPVDFFWGR